MKSMVLAGLLGLGCMAAAKTTVAQAPKVVLVELFTSEGCSSCPPADALLRKLDGKVEDGTLIVGLSEHVTYWNSLGWRDPFSQDLFTARQQGYGDRFNLRSVYTPQVVVNGEREVLGSDEGALLKAAAATGKRAPVAVAIESAVAEGSKLKVTYKLTGDAGGADVWAVIAQNMATTSVPRGENAGRTLKHTSVAQTMVKLGAAKGDGLRTGVVDLPVGTGERHVVLFVQESGQGKVLGVDMRAL